MKLAKTRGVYPAKRLYSTKEAAGYLGRSVTALREMMWNGKIKYIRDGRRILFDIKDMDEWIETHKRTYTIG